MLIKDYYDNTYRITHCNTKPPVCKKCVHYNYSRGSWCERVESKKVFNVITGETESMLMLWKCQEQRYSEKQHDCGLEGKFFIQKG